MKYYLVLYNNEYAKKRGRFAGVRIDDKFDWYLFEDAQPFPHELFIKIHPRVDRGDLSQKILADFQMCYTPCWRIISKKMYAIVQKFSDETSVNYYKLNIEDNGGLVNYYFMHFQNSLNVIDEERSKIKLLHPIVRPELLDGIDVFWCKDICTSEFCISERVKQELEQAGITGCSYQEIS